MLMAKELDCTARPVLFPAASKTLPSRVMGWAVGTKNSASPQLSKLTA